MGYLVIAYPAVSSYVSFCLHSVLHIGGRICSTCDAYGISALPHAYIQMLKNLGRYSTTSYPTEHLCFLREYT